jgi:hypothetical protein
MTETTTIPKPGTPEYDAHMIAVAERGTAEIRINENDQNNGGKPTSTVIKMGEPAPTNATANVAPGTTPAAAPTKAQRPDNVPEKFWDAEKGVVNTEALLKSYGELERAKSKPGLADPSQTTKPATTPAPKAPAAPAKSDALTAAEAELAAATTPEAKAAAQTKVDSAKAADEAARQAAQSGALQSIVEGASAEWAEKGELSAETYAKLEAQGLSKDYVDAYVDGMKARAEVVTNKVFAEAGGQEKYQQIREWAVANLTAEEIAAANAAFDSGDINVVLGQVRSLTNAYNMANGVQGTVSIQGQGGAAGVSSVEPFRTQSDMIAAMNDARYRSDATYRKQVESRIAASMKQNIDLGF